MEPALSLSGVSKRFGSFAALRGVDLEVPAGEIFGLLGPNGAGKSTLIHCITGLARPSEGRIRVFGYDAITEYRQTRRRVGLVPQEINFDPFFTPVESLLIQMGLMGVEPSEARAHALLETFALADKAHTHTRQLSGGMKRRLLVAKALVHRPRLLFLDEPTAGVDVELRQDLWREVRRLRAEGTTIILTTHYLEEAEALSDRIGILREGELVVVDEREALIARHRQRHLTLSLDAPLTAVPNGLPEDAHLVDDRTLTTTWQTPEDLERILTATRRAAPVRDVHSTQTTLEDVFLELTGRNEEAGR